MVALTLNALDTIYRTGVVSDRHRLESSDNQEDMAYTLLTFSYVILRAFHDMDIEVSVAETEAYLHCWNVVGHIIGVREDLLAYSFEGAEFLISKIKSGQMGGSAAGQDLANTLVNCTQEIILHETGGIFDRSFIRHFPPIMIRLLLDKKTVSILRIKRLTFFEWMILSMVRLLVAPFQSLYQKLVLALGTKFGLLIVDNITHISRGWNRRLFQLPQQLRTAWKTRTAKH